LERVAPGAVDSLVRSSEVLRDEEEWIEGIVAEAFERAQAREPFPGGVGLSTAELAAAPTALRRRLVRHAIGLVRGGLDGIDSAHVEAAIAVAVGVGERARDLPGVRVKVESDVLRFLPLAGRRLADPVG
jgi:tRNA(Ile)-lysidine synthase